MEDKRLGKTDKDADFALVLAELETKDGGKKCLKIASKPERKRRQVSREEFKSIPSGSHVAVKRVPLVGRSYVHHGITTDESALGRRIIHFQPGKPLEADMREKGIKYEPAAEIIFSSWTEFLENSTVLYVYDYKKGLDAKATLMLAKRLVSSQSYNVISWNCKTMAVFCRSLYSPGTFLEALRTEQVGKQALPFATSMMIRGLSVGAHVGLRVAKAFTMIAPKLLKFIPFGGALINLGFTFFDVVSDMIKYLYAADYTLDTFRHLCVTKIVPIISANLMVTIPLLALEIVLAILCPPAALPVGMVLGLLSIPAIGLLKHIAKFLIQLLPPPWNGGNITRESIKQLTDKDLEAPPVVPPPIAKWHVSLSVDEADWKRRNPAHIMCPDSCDIDIDPNERVQAVKEVALEQFKSKYLNGATLADFCLEYAAPELGVNAPVATVRERLPPSRPLRFVVRPPKEDARIRKDAITGGDDCIVQIYVKRIT